MRFIKFLTIPIMLAVFGFVSNILETEVSGLNIIKNIAVMSIVVYISILVFAYKQHGVKFDLYTFHWTAVPMFKFASVLILLVSVLFQFVPNIANALEFIGFSVSEGSAGIGAGIGLLTIATKESEESGDV